jgi:HK97 family phage major capsid protein
LTAGSDPAGGYLIETQHMAAEFVELLRNKMLLVPLGARILTGLRGNVDIPTQTGAATAYWLGEDEAITPTDQTFGSINLTPHTVGGLTRFTRRMLLQSSPDVEGVVRGDLAEVCAIAIDRVGINGGGSNEPDGILQVSGVAPITTSGTLTWAKILEFTAAVEGANADVGQLAFLTNPATKSRLLSTEKATGFPVYLWEFGSNGQGMMAGYRAFATSNVPATLGVGNNKSAIIFGNWADLIIGQWGPLDILSDPYTDMNKGAVRVRAFMDVDIGIRHAASFAVAQDV